MLHFGARSQKDFILAELDFILNECAEQVHPEAGGIGYNVCSAGAISAEAVSAAPRQFVSSGNAGVILKLEISRVPSLPKDRIQALVIVVVELNLGLRAVWVHVAPAQQYILG